MKEGGGQLPNVEELCRSYLAAMENGDLEALLSIFTEDAMATSPISGKQPVRDFYSYVMRITSARSMTLRTIFTGVSDPTRAAIHIAYTRTVGNGKPATIEGVDVFELTEDLSKFTSVSIIYDTAPVRSDFDRL
jgi:ketosteroid isomerase-like protein